MNIDTPNQQTPLEKAKVNDILDVSQMNQQWQMKVQFGIYSNNEQKSWWWRLQAGSFLHPNEDRCAEWWKLRWKDYPIERSRPVVSN